MELRLFKSIFDTMFTKRSESVAVFLCGFVDFSRGYCITVNHKEIILRYNILLNYYYLKSYL